MPPARPRICAGGTNTVRNARLGVRLCTNMVTPHASDTSFLPLPKVDAPGVVRAHVAALRDRAVQLDMFQVRAQRPANLARRKYLRAARAMRAAGHMCTRAR
eukprot:7872750-Pyramimonas_sp.AAC.1